MLPVKLRRRRGVVDPPAAGRRRPSAAALAIVLALLAACGPEPGGEAPAQGPDPGSPSAETATQAPGADPPDGAPFDAVPFTEGAAAAGLDFVHFNGMSGGYYFSEMMGSGAALFDADGDGDLDVYLVQGSMLGDGDLDGATFPPRPLDRPPRDRLYRNDLEAGAEGEPGLRFSDVTDDAGLDVLDYGMGVAAADFDNDGRVDLYVTAAGTNRHLRNVGEGGSIAFEDVTDDVTGIGRWSVPAAVLDFDRDGWLDLYVGNYVDYSVANDKSCTDELGQPNYCGPLAYAPEPDTLLRNRGDGTFEDWSGRAGILREYGGCLGAVAADFDQDGWIDVYVANDGTPNQLWMNNGDGTFENRALLAGSAVNAQGHAEASMGVAVADVDGDGDQDLFLTHLTRETNTFYANSGDASFVDRSAESGLGAPSFDRTAFGVGWIDVENDGLLDLLVVNGAVKVIKPLALAGDPYPLHQPNQLFRNVGGGRFEDASAGAGAAFDPSEVSRGAAFGDLDDDGDLDVVVTNNAGPVRLLRNLLGQDRPWLGLRLLDASGRDAHGA
ncbi:MAG: VCBS repeat-containing protein, partial [Acidobacteriota bacterium]